MKKLLVILILLLHANSSLLVARPLEGCNMPRGISQAIEVDSFFDLLSSIQQNDQGLQKKKDDQKPLVVTFEEAEDVHCTAQHPSLPSIFPIFTVLTLGDTHDQYMPSCSFEIIAPPPEQ